MDLKICAADKLTVIIPSWNQCELLRGCLQSLRNQTVSCSVLVVDNGSRDETAEMVEVERASFPGKLSLLRLSRNFGFARAANEGIRRTETPFVALLNNDTEADPRWVETGLHASSKYPEYSFFASRIVNFWERGILDSAGDCYTRTGIAYKRGFGHPVEGFSRSEPVLGASAAAAFYRSTLFQDIGVFDEDYYIYLEDVEFSLRAHLFGHRCLYLPDAVVYHIEAASDPDRGPNQAHERTATGPRYSGYRVYWITRNRWQLMVTYQPLQHWPWLLYAWLRSLGSHLLRRRFLAAFFSGMFSGIGQTLKALEKRQCLSRRRVLSTRELCQLLKEC